MEIKKICLSACSLMFHIARLFDLEILRNGGKSNVKYICDAITNEKSALSQIWFRFPRIVSFISLN